jgi:uncharacterized protein YegL
MPALNTGDMEEIKVSGSGYSFSAIGLDNADLASEYTLATILVDTSGSVSRFRADLEAALESIVEACQSSPRADFLMVRLVEFNSSETELHGYKLLSAIKKGDYIGTINPRSSTALYETTFHAVQALGTYAEMMDTDKDISSNGIIFIITDGMDNEGGATPKMIKQEIEKVQRQEVLESLVTVLIGVGTKGDSYVSDSLREFKDNAGISKYIETEDVNENTLAKIAEFVSSSISVVSSSLESGGPSKLLSLNI